MSLAGRRFSLDHNCGSCFRNGAESIVYLAAAMIFLSCASCGPRSKGIYPVTGKVTYQGLPASGAAIFFYRQGAIRADEQTVMGIVKEDGTFELVCGSLGKGAPPGEYEIVIEWKDVTGSNKGGPKRGSDKLKGRYADRNHPRLHATIKAETNKLAPFELTDDE